MIEATRWIAWALLVMAVANIYFVRDGYMWYRAVSPPSPLLRALLAVKIIVWLAGLFIGYIAFRLLAGQPALPFNGIGVGIAVIVLELLPVYIWFQMRRFTDEELARDQVRDDARDTGRDLVRDPARDAARDAELDNDQ